MRRAALLLLTSCGRLAFDELPGQGARDAAALTCTPDGSHDEDGDGLPDACDPCPTRAGTAADVDGDGVGDACDPYPTPTERLAVFDPFTGPGSSWQPFGTSAFSPSLGIDVLRLPGLGDSSTAYQVLPPGRETIEVRARTTAVSAMPHALSIKVGEADRVRRYHCELRVSGDTLTFGLLYTLDGTTFTAVDDVVAANAIFAKDVVLTMQRALPDVTCTAAVGDQLYTAGGQLPVQLVDAEVWVAAVKLDADVASVTRVVTP